MIPDPYRFVPLRSEDRRDVVTLDSLVFPDPHSVDDLLQTPDPAEWDRMWGIRAGEQLAAVHGTYSLKRYPVPGAHTACGWLTWVGVHPGHRRRGLLRAMIDHHLQECRDRGEAISGLFAAEPGIYGRFGYGMAARHAELTLPRRAELRPIPGSEAIDIEIGAYSSDEHGALISDLHRRSGDAGPGRPGWATWETPGLRASRTTVTPVFSAGKEPLRILLAFDSGEPVGYATFRRTLTWEPAGPEGTVRVSDFVSLTPRATRRMWSVLADLDLSSEVTTPMLAVDDPLLDLLVDIRRARPRFQDNTWLRIVDLQAAVQARHLTGELDAVLEVRDDLIEGNSGRWRVAGSAWAQPEVSRTDAAPHLSLDIRELSAAYLGGANLMAAAQAGFVDVHDQQVAAKAAQAFTWPLAPVVNWVF